MSRIQIQYGNPKMVYACICLFLVSDPYLIEAFEIKDLSFLDKLSVTWVFLAACFKFVFLSISCFWELFLVVVLIFTVPSPVTDIVRTGLPFSVSW